MDLSAGMKSKLQSLARGSTPTRRQRNREEGARSPAPGVSPVTQDPPTPGAGKKKRQREGDGGAEPSSDRSGTRRGKGGDDDDSAPQPILGVIPNITLEDLGGLHTEQSHIKELVEYPIRCPHLYSMLGADPPCGVLLHGPPGCGKTQLGRAIAGTLQVPLFYLSAPEVVSGVSGDSEAKIRTLFQDAISSAPSIVFLDEIDTIAGHRDSAQREMSRRIVGQLLTCMDQLGQAWKEFKKVVTVIGATNRPEAIDSGLRRAGRFDREIALGIPSLDDRISILKVLMKDLKMEENIPMQELGLMTPGYVGADLHLLLKEAAALAMRRTIDKLTALGKDISQPLSEEDAAAFAVSLADFRVASKRVQPSAMREGFTTIPNVTWSDVGALEDVRRELVQSIMQPIRTPKLHRAFGLSNPSGILLYGPPGCGKTLVAKAIANECGANFISIKGPELLNKFVGESERAVRMVFARGRASAPCVLFFDEMDALAPKRGSDKANPSSERVVNQLLTELDGVEGREGVYVIAATNRPDMIDAAMLRGGRLEKKLFVPLPTNEQRVLILETIAKKMPIHPDVDFAAVSNRCEGFSGADLAAMMREASVTALNAIYSTKTEEELMEGERNGAEGLLGYDGKFNADGTPVDDGGRQYHVEWQHVETALGKVKPSVSKSDRVKYETMRSLDADE